MTRNLNRPFQIFICSAVFGAGIGVFGRFILDELFISALLLTLGVVACLAIYQKENPWAVLKQRTFEVLKDQNIFLILFFVFFFLQSIRSYLTEYDHNHLFYGAHFLYLIAAIIGFSILTKNAQKKKDILGYAVWVVIIYNIVYILLSYGVELAGQFLSDTIQNRYSFQGLYWSGSAYAVLPALFGAYCTIASPKVNHWRNIALSLSIFLISMVYTSRISTVVALLCIGYSLLCYNFTRKTIIRLTVVLMVVVIGTYNYIPRVQIILQDAVDATTFLTNPRGIIGGSAETGDYDRYAHFYSGFRAINNKDTLTLLFGYGDRQHRAVVGEHIYNIIAEHPTHSQVIGSKPLEHIRIRNEALKNQEISLWGGMRTTTFTAIIIDGGLVGLALWILAILSTLIKAIRHANRHKFSLSKTFGYLGLFGSVALWPSLIFLNDATIYWFLFCPIFLWASEQKTEIRTKIEF